MSALNWHREYRTGPRKRVVTGVKAWATDLEPASPMPPYYRIARPSQSSTLRVVWLINCKSCGGDRVKVGPAGDLASAKQLAQDDYGKRVSEQPARQR